MERARGRSLPNLPGSALPAAPDQCLERPSPPPRRRVRRLPVPPPHSPEPAPAENPWAFWRSVLITLVVALGIRQFLLEARYIPSGSMLPGLQLQDRLLVEKLSYRSREPRRRRDRGVSLALSLRSRPGDGPQSEPAPLPAGEPSLRGRPARPAGAGLRRLHQAGGGSAGGEGRGGSPRPGVHRRRAPAGALRPQLLPGRCPGDRPLPHPEHGGSPGPRARARRQPRQQLGCALLARWSLPSPEGDHRSGLLALLPLQQHGEPGPAPESRTPAP